MPNVRNTIQSYFHFCPHCGARLRMRRIHGKPELGCLACRYTFWMNSKPTASVLLVRNGSVLLTRRAIAPYKGGWDVPGGFLDVHEDPVRGLQREMREELGIHVRQPKLLGIYMDTYASKPLQSTLNIYYTATRWSGTLKPCDDVAAFAWLPLKKLPTRIAFTSGKQALRDLRRQLRND